MADILIRGMEMPRNCFECPLFTNCDACEGHECGCGLLGGIGYEEDISEDRRRDDCPLIELPPHGDLILKDDAIVAVKLLSDLYPEYRKILAVLWDQIKDLTVIIPESEEVTNDPKT